MGWRMRFGTCWQTSRHGKGWWKTPGASWNRIEAPPPEPRSSYSLSKRTIETYCPRNTKTDETIGGTSLGLLPKCQKQAFAPAGAGVVLACEVKQNRHASLSEVEGPL